MFKKHLCKSKILRKVRVYRKVTPGCNELKAHWGNESPLKVMKIAFYFTLNALFGCKILEFVSWIFGHVYLIKRIRLFSKFMTSQSGQQNIAIHILTNISRSKDNQAMKFCQLTKYSTNNIFLEKLYIKCGRVL